VQPFRRNVVFRSQQLQPNTGSLPVEPIVQPMTHNHIRSTEQNKNLDVIVKNKIIQLNKNNTVKEKSNKDNKQDPR
jgi:hypothetical protein